MPCLGGLAQVWGVGQGFRSGVYDFCCLRPGEPEVPAHLRGQAGFHGQPLAKFNSFTEIAGLDHHKSLVVQLCLLLYRFNLTLL